MEAATLSFSMQVHEESMLTENPPQKTVCSALIGCGYKPHETGCLITEIEQTDRI